MLNYNIRISGIKNGSHEFFFNIENSFFESFVNSEVRNAKINAHALLVKEANKLQLSLTIHGVICNLLCDLCANEIKMPVSNSLSILIQESNYNIENTDEILYVKPNQHEIDISHLIYEAIILSIPMKREHNEEYGNKCDQSVIELLDIYESKEKTQDPRWEKLTKVKDLI